MDPIIYFMAEYFPWWAIPSVLIFGEAGNHFRRVGNKTLFAICLLISIGLVVANILYFTHDGFQNLRPAMQNFERQYGK